jgi:hypothetical protein
MGSVEGKFGIDDVRHHNLNGRQEPSGVGKRLVSPVIVPSIMAVLFDRLL